MFGRASAGLDEKVIAIVVARIAVAIPALTIRVARCDIVFASYCKIDVRTSGSVSNRSYFFGGLLGGWQDPQGFLGVTMLALASAGLDEKVSAMVAARNAAARLEAQMIRVARCDI